MKIEKALEIFDAAQKAAGDEPFEIDVNNVPKNEIEKFSQQEGIPITRSIKGCSCCFNPKTGQSLWIWSVIY